MSTVYRTVNTSLWTDPKIRKLSADGKLLMLYLITCPHTNVGGIYYVPEIVVMHETGLKKNALDTLWDTLSKLGLVLRDAKNEVVWVVNMLKYQGRGPKVVAAVANQLLTLHNSQLINKFLQRYPDVKPVYEDKVSNRVSHGVSEFGNPDMDQDSDQEQEQDQEDLPTEGCTETAGPAVSPPAVVLEFPTEGKGGNRWSLTEAKLAEYVAVYPNLDVMSEMRKALQWCRDNPAKLKTRGGMPSFLTRWLNRAQDKPRAGPLVSVGEVRPALDPSIWSGNE